MLPAHLAKGAGSIYRKVKLLPECQHQTANNIKMAKDPLTGMEQ